jgi:hypothetical protein
MLSLLCLSTPRRRISVMVWGRRARLSLTPFPIQKRSAGPTKAPSMTSPPHFETDNRRANVRCQQAVVQASLKPAQVCQLTRCSLKLVPVVAHTSDQLFH